MKTLVAIALLMLLSGCAVVCYMRIGPQKAKKVQVIVEEQEADPNIPKGLIEAGLIKL